MTGRFGLRSPERSIRSALGAVPDAKLARTTLWRGKHVAGSAALVITALAAAVPAASALEVAQFAVTPSTTQARGHPNLTVTTSFGDTGAGIKDIALHLPAGLDANPRALPFCSRKRLLADLCPARSKAGTLTVTGEAFGLEVTAANPIHNVRPRGSERLRLAVPIVGSVSRPGLAAELPVVQRPGDRGLDLAVTGLPGEVNGIRVRIRRVSFSLRGVARVRVKGRLRKRAFLTNPGVCRPATSILEVTSHDAPPARITRGSSFVPTGCTAPN